MGPSTVDFNSSGLVDATDLAIWESGFGTGTSQSEGDADADGDVDGADFLAWQRGFGTSGSATQSQGDADGDSDVDSADFLAWQRTFGQAPPPAECIDISIDGLSEAVEENPGAIIWRNSDFSKQSLDATQPEAGEPLYVPDYSAPSSVYDPNNANDFTNATVEIDPGMIGNYDVRFTFDNLQIELWTPSTWAGLDAQGGGLSKIQSGFNLVPNSNMISFQIEGLDNSTAFATDFIQVEAIPTGGGATLEDKGFYTVVETGIGVDGNRDTNIDFDNSHDRQLLFWLNNDQEGLHAVDTAVEAEQPNITSADNTDGVIGQRRDLEDLAPLRVSVDPLLVANSFDTAGAGSAGPGQLEVTYRVLLENPGGASLRLFYSNNTQANVIRHVSDDNIANIQATDAFFRVAAGASFSDQLQLEQISSGENSYLFEAIGTGYGLGFASTPTLVFQTTIEYADGSKTTKRQEVELDLRDIKSFYTRWDIDYGVNGGSPGTDLRTDLSFQHYATPTTAEHTSQIQNKSFLSGDDTVVLVHGWNMPDTTNEDWKAAFSETAFKRQYWQGFRGEFVSFNWPTFSDSEGPDWPIFGVGANVTYNASDFQAYRSANALKEVLADYRGETLEPVQLLAHSMGNIVAGEALRIWTYEFPFNDDPLVTNYVAMEAAVSSGAYGSNDTDSSVIGRPIPDLYRFWSHGRNGFADAGLGTSFYFQGASFASENTVNLYNPADFALDLWDLNNFGKDLYIQSPLWPYDYEFTAGAGGNVNDDDFVRTETGNPDVSLTSLTDAFGRPGVDAYEILAFFSQSASLALGTKAVNRFDTNINFASSGLSGGNDIRANHSYQFGHDSAETWDFWSTIKSETGFGATLPLLAAIEQTQDAAISTVPLALGQAPKDFQPILLETETLRAGTVARAAVFEEIGYTNRDARLGFDLLPAIAAFEPSKAHAASVFPLRHERDGKTTDQKSTDFFFDDFDGVIVRSHLLSSLEGNRVSS